MRIIRGKYASSIDSLTLAERLTGYASIHLDIGTGDGRYVQQMAQPCPERFIIGIDACLENLRPISRRAPANTLFIIANALALPSELQGLAASITINFPWGSLLEGLLANDGGLMGGLAMVARPDANLEIRLNAGALAEADWSLDEGADRVCAVLALNGHAVQPPVALSASDLKSYPTTWAKRLAFGRDPRAVYLRAILQADALSGLSRPGG